MAISPTMLAKRVLFLLFVGSVAVRSSQFVPNSYIVEFEDNADATSVLSHVEATKTMNFDSELFKGAAIAFENGVQSAQDQVSQLKSIPKVKNVWPNKIFPRPDYRVEAVPPAGPSVMVPVPPRKRAFSNDTNVPHVQTQVDKLRAKGFTGKGVKVAIIDSGIDYKHPALGNGCYGSPDCLVVGGYDFVGDNYNGTTEAVPDNDPYDNCGGHGTHVAGIVAAQENVLGFTGAAPGVKLTAYRVFGCKGFTSTEIMIAAFLRAYDDGANIITISIGAPTGWSEEEGSVILSRLVEKGVIVTVAAGNSASEGIFYPSSPAGGKGVAAIASYDNEITPVISIPSRYTISGGEQTSFEYALGNPGKWAGVNLSLWTPSFNTNETAQRCDPFPKDTPDLSDKIVLIRRGACPYKLSAQNAAASKAKYVMYYNNADLPVNVFVDVDGILATGMVSSALGTTWVKALQAGQNITLDMLDPGSGILKVDQYANNVTGGDPSTYTSWGPSFEAEVKPQFGTPGGKILSTWPVAMGEYAVLSGTSMATPLAAAIYALISNARNTTDPVLLQNLIAATAKPGQLNEGKMRSPLLAPVPQQGAGMIQAYDAAYATTILSQTSIAFNDSIRLEEKSFTITNGGQESVTYELDVVGAATVYTFSNSTQADPFPGVKLDDSYSTLKLSEYKVTVPAGGKSTIAVKVTPPAIDPARLPVYSGYIRLNGTNGERLSLPYQGIVGDLNSRVVLNTTYVSRSLAQPDYPPINPSNSTFFLPRYNITNFNVENLPTAVVDMTFGSPLINIEIWSADNQTHKLGAMKGSPFTWQPRGSLQYDWTGQLADLTYAPAGKYEFRVSALRVYGDANDTKQYDHAVSDSFTIRYKD